MRLNFVNDVILSDDQWPHLVFCEAGEAHLTKPGWCKPHTHSNPTNLALFRHKITLYRFNQGGSYYCRAGAQMGAGGWAPRGPLTLTTADDKWIYIYTKMWILYRCPEKDSTDIYVYSYWQGVATASVQQDTISKEYVIIFNTACSR